MKKTNERKVYLVPQCQIAHMNEESNLMATSFPSQHNPGHHGTGPTGAKMFRLSSDEDELVPVGRSGYSPWDD